MFIIAVASGDIHTEEPLGQAGSLFPRWLVGWGKPGAHCWLIPACPTPNRYTLHQAGNGAATAPFSTIHWDKSALGIETQIRSLSLSPNCIYPKKKMFLWFSAWEKPQIPLFYSHFLHIARKEVKNGTNSDTTMISLCPSCGCFLGKLISPPALQSWAPGDTRLAKGPPFLFSMQRLDWNRHHCSIFHISPEKKVLRRGYLDSHVYLDCPLVLSCTPGWDLLRQDFELPRKFNSHLGFYFVN